MNSFKKFIFFLISLILIFFIFYFLYTPIKTQFNFQREIFLDFPKIETDYYAIFSFPEIKLISGKNIKEKYPLASITKLITAYLVFKGNLLEKEILIDKKILSLGGIFSNFKPSERIKMIDLVRIFLKNSSNKAADLVFENIEKNLREKILFELKNSGADFEIFDGSGLNIKNKGSALDLAIFFKKIFDEYPQILDFSKEGSGIYNGKYVLNLNGKYKNFLGGKVGTLPEIGFNFAGLFEFANKKYLIIIFGAKDFFVEVDKIVSFFDKNIELFPFCNEKSKVLGNYKRACKIEPILKEKNYFELSIGNARLRIIENGKILREYYLKASSKIYNFSWLLNPGIYFLEKLDNKIYLKNNIGNTITLGPKEEDNADIKILAEKEDYLEILTFINTSTQFLIFW